MLNGWHVRWVCWLCKNWDVFSFQELCTDLFNMGLCIIMLQHEAMVVVEWHNNRTQDLITVSLCIQNVWAGVVTHGLLLWGWLDVRNSLKCLWRRLMVKKNEHSIHGQQLWWTFLQSACQLHAPSKLATFVTLCCLKKLHILKWPFIVCSLRHTCAIIMLSNQHLSNQHLDIAHLWGGWIISAKEKYSLTQIETDLWAIFERKRAFVCREKVLDL